MSWLVPFFIGCCLVYMTKSCNAIILKENFFFDGKQKHGFIIVITVFKKLVWSCKVSVLWDKIRFYSYISRSKTEYAKKTDKMPP